MAARRVREKEGEGEIRDPAPSDVPSGCRLWHPSSLAVAKRPGPAISGLPPEVAAPYIRPPIPQISPHGLTILPLRHHGFYHR